MKKGKKIENKLSRRIRHFDLLSDEAKRAGNGKAYRQPGSRNPKKC